MRRSLPIFIQAHRMNRLRNWVASRKAIEIVEEDGVRVLQIGGKAIQSAMRLDAPFCDNSHLKL